MEPDLVATPNQRTVVMFMDTQTPITSILKVYDLNLNTMLLTERSPTVFENIESTPFFSDPPLVEDVRVQKRNAGNLLIAHSEKKVASFYINQSSFLMGIDFTTDIPPATALGAPGPLAIAIRYRTGPETTIKGVYPVDGTNG